jgi:hypothetical protein
VTARLFVVSSRGGENAVMGRLIMLGNSENVCLDCSLL